MAISHETTVEALAERLTLSFKAQMQKALEDAFKKHAEILIRDTAERMAKGLYGMVHTTREAMTGELTVILRIDGVNKIIEQETKNDR